MASQARKQARCEPTYNPDVGGTQSVAVRKVGWHSTSRRVSLKYVRKASAYSLLSVCALMIRNTHSRGVIQASSGMPAPDVFIQGVNANFRR